jgi:hypothetical protein
MEDIAEAKPDDTSATPDLGVNPPADDLDQLLQEFQDKTAQPEPTEPVNTDVNIADVQSTNNALDELLAGFDSSNADQNRISELQGRVDALQTEAHRTRELEAFSEFADDLQKQLPSFVPPDYAEAKLRSLAHDQELCLAWDLRNTDRSAANLELAKVQNALLQLQQNPAADPAQVRQLQEYGFRLQVAVNAPAILRKARLDIINQAAKLKPPIDEDTTAWRAEIAASMRGASMPLDYKDPPPISAKCLMPNLGILPDVTMASR